MSTSETEEENKVAEMNTEEPDESEEESNEEIKFEKGKPKKKPETRRRRKAPIPRGQTTHPTQSHVYFSPATHPNQFTHYSYGAPHPGPHPGPQVGPQAQHSSGLSIPWSSVILLAIIFGLSLYIHFTQFAGKVIDVEDNIVVDVVPFPQNPNPTPDTGPKQALSPEPAIIPREVQQEIKKLNDANCFIRRGGLIEVRNLTNQEILIGATAATEFGDVFLRMDRCRNIFKKKTPICLAHHHFIEKHDGFGIRATNLISLQMPNNSSRVHAINMELVGVRKNVKIIQDIYSPRFMNSQAVEFKGYETIWVEFIDHNLRKITMDNEKEQCKNKDASCLQQFDRKTRLRLSGDAAVCIQVVLREMKGPSYDPFYTLY